MYPVHHNKLIVADSICLSAFHMIYHNRMNSKERERGREREIPQQDEF